MRLRALLFLGLIDGERSCEDDKSSRYGLLLLARWISLPQRCIAGSNPAIFEKESPGTQAGSAEAESAPSSKVVGGPARSGYPGEH